MGVYAGPDVSESGLVLSFDGANLKSFKGEPTTNLITNGDFSSGLSGWSDYVDTTKTILSSRSLPFSQDIEKSYLNCKSQSAAGPGGNYGGVLRSIGATTAGVTYTISYWARSLSGSLELKFSFQTGIGDENNLSHSRTLTSEWVKYSHTATLNIAKGTLFIWNQNISSGTFEITNIQLEAKSSPTTFVNGTRGSTVATGGGWADMSGNGNHGQLVNGVRESSDGLGSLVFDGTNDICSLSNPIPSSPTSPFTFDVIARRTASFSWQTIISMTGSYTQLAFGSDNKIKFGRNAGNGGINVDSNFNALLGTWYHIVGTYDGNQSGSNAYVNIYVNGAIALANGNMGVNGYNNGTGVRLGAHGLTTPGEYLSGNIAMVKVYNRALTPAEIQQNFNSTRARYGI